MMVALFVLFTCFSIFRLLNCMSAGVGSIASPECDFCVVVSGCFSPFA